MDEQEDLEIDMSWMEEQEKLENMNEISYRESMKQIQCYLFFVDKMNDVSNIVSKNLKIVENVISKDAISEMIMNNNTNGFIVDDIILYNITIEPQQIQSFSNSILENNGISQCSFFKNGQLNRDILIQPSIFIFHRVNCLIVLLREQVEPKSIMKKTGGGGKSTKKVRIIIGPNITKNKTKLRSTRKVSLTTIGG